PAVPHLHRYYGVVRLLVHPFSVASGLPWRSRYRSGERRDGELSWVPGESLCALYLCPFPRNGHTSLALRPRYSRSLFAFGQLPASYRHVPRFTAQPRHSSTPLLPTIEFA